VRPGEGSRLAKDGLSRPHLGAPGAPHAHRELGRDLAVEHAGDLGIGEQLAVEADRPTRASRRPWRPPPPDLPGPDTHVGRTSTWRPRFTRSEITTCSPIWHPSPIWAQEHTIARRSCAPAPTRTSFHSTDLSSLASAPTTERRPTTESTTRAPASMRAPSPTTMRPASSASSAYVGGGMGIEFRRGVLPELTGQIDAHGAAPQVVVHLTVCLGAPHVSPVALGDIAVQRGLLGKQPREEVPGEIHELASRAAWRGLPAR